MTIDLLVEKLIAEIKSVRKTDTQLESASPVPAEAQGPAFVKTAGAASEAEAAVLEQIALLDERHAEEIAAEERAEARADEEEKEEDDEIHNDDNDNKGDQGFEDLGDGVVVETLHVAFADSEMESAETASNDPETVNSVLSVSGGSEGGGWSAPGWLAPAGALGAAAIGGGIAAASGSSSDRDAPLPPVTPASTTISGTVMMGPVTRGLSVNIYDDQGNLLGAGEVDENSQYQIEIDDYSGMVLVRLSDDNAADGNYMDEALGVEQDLTVELRAMTVVSGGEAVINVTPLTELAVRELGLETTDDVNLSGVTATEEQVEAVNLAISRLFLGEDAPSIEVADIAPVIDRDGNDTVDTSNTYGKLLAALSGADASETIAGDIGMEATIAALSAAITDAFAGSDVTWEDQDDDGVEARAIVQFGLEVANGNENLALDDDSFLDDAGLRADESGPVVAQTTVSINENSIDAIELSAQDESGVASWAFASGEGDADNDLFDLSAEGGLALKVAENFEASEAPFSIRVAVTDTLGNVAEQIMTVNIADVNEAPAAAALVNQDSIIYQDFTYDASAAFSDIDSGDTLTFSAEGLPEGYAIDSATGVISGRAPDGGDATVTVTATDSGGLTASQSFTVSVFAAPVIVSVEGEGPVFARQGDEVVLTLAMSERVTLDIPGDAPTLTLDLNGEEMTATYDSQDSEDGRILYFKFVAPAGDGDDLTIASINLGDVTVVGDDTGEGWLTDIVDQTTDTVTIDNTAPTLAITTDKENVIAGETVLVTFTFSEEPASFELSDISYSSGLLSDLQADPENPAVYTAVFTPDADATTNTTFDVLAESYEDRAGNQGAGSASSNSVDIDTAIPEITDIDLNLVTGELTVSFDEAPADFTIDDIIVEGGVLSNLRLVDDGVLTAYVADFTEDLSFTGEFSAAIDNGAYTDEAGNPGLGDGTPILSVSSPTSNGYVRGDQLSALTISGKGTDGANIGFTIFNKTTLAPQGGAGAAVVNGEFWSQGVNLESVLDDGVYVIQASANIGGKTVVGVVQEFTIDRQIADPVITSAPNLISDASFDENGDLTLTGTVETDVSSVNIQWASSVSPGPNDPGKDAVIDAAGVWTVTFTREELAEMPDGGASFVVTAEDLAGNEAETTSEAVTLELVNENPAANLSQTIEPQIVIVDAASGTEILDLTDLADDGGDTDNDVAFTDPDDSGAANGQLTYTATLADGTALPAWLEVTPAGIIQVAAGQTAPSAAESLSIEVTATDGGDLSASREVDINIVAAPTVTSIAATSGAFQTDDSFTFDLVMSEDVTIDTGGGSPTLTLDVNGASVTATYVSQPNASTLRFTADAPSAEGAAVSISAINLNGATVTGDSSAVGWATDVVGQSTDQITIDNTGPTISTVSIAVNENATAVGVLAATDNFDTDVGWSLVSGIGDTDNAQFQLGLDGVLTLRDAQDFEAGKENYAIRVRAIDDAGNETEQQVTVTLQDVNETPEDSGEVIDTQIVLVNATAGTEILDLTDLADNDDVTEDDVAFTDPDDSGTANGQLTYTATLADGTALPAWLEVTSAGIIQVAAGQTAPSAAESLSIEVTATDGGELSASREVDINIVAAPTLSTLADDVNNLDVRSDLVMTASENVSLTTVEGVYDITIKDLGGVNSGQGYRQENNDNTQTIRITINSSGAVASVETLIGDPANPSYPESHAAIADVLTIAGDSITINPFFDLDLSSNYQIDVSGGLFIGDSSGQGSIAFDGATAADFSTVNPEAASSAAAAEQAQWFDASGALVDSHQWISIDTVGDSTGANPTAIGSLDGDGYIIVFKDWDLDGVGATEISSDQEGAIDGSRANNFYVIASDFGLDDLVYIDDQHNNAIANTPGDGGAQWNNDRGATLLQRDGGTGQGAGLLLLQAATGLDFSGAEAIDNPLAAGVNLSEALNGFGVSPVIGG